MKVLILSCNTGQGHNAAATAIAEEFSARGIECTIQDTLAFGKNSTSNVISDGYMKMTAKVPWLFHMVYKAGDFVSAKLSFLPSPIYIANSKYAKPLYQFIVENEYDQVICPHLFPAEALTYIKKHYNPSITTSFVATDYTCTPFTEECKPDWFFIPHKDLIDEYAKKGIPEEKLIPLGIPVLKKFTTRTPKKTARKTLGIQEDSRVFLIMTGSMGFGNITGMIRKLIHLADKKTKIFILTGKNPELKKKIDTTFFLERRVQAIAFTTEVDIYMDASDVILSKPGGLSSTETAAKNIPLIHTVQIPGCETLNAEFFSSRKMSIHVTNANVIARLAYDLSDNEKKINEMTAAQNQHINKNAARDICDFLIQRGDSIK